MRPAFALLALLCVTPSTRAQSGMGTLHGAVLPISHAHAGGFGDWYAAFDAHARMLPQAVRDTLPVAHLTLTPVEGPVSDRATASARGLYGRYRFAPLRMGRYRLRVEAEGCAAYETDVVILSDSESVQHVALTCPDLR